MAQTVIGLFDSASEAQRAVEQLVSNGFSRSNIDVSASGSSTGSSSSDLGTSGSYGSSSTDLGSTGSYGSSTGLGTSDLSGTSGSYGSSTGLGTSDLSGTSGSYGTGSNTLGTSGLSGTTGSSYDSTTGSSSGEHEGIGHSISRFFSNLFGNDDEANTYSGVANRSGSIVTVHAQSAQEAEQAADILDDNGAIDVNERAQQYGSATRSASTGSYDTTATTGTTSSTNVTSGDQATSIPIIEENLQVGKRTVETGGARLRSRIVERPVEESLRLREERVTVERNPVNRVATDADFSNFKEGTIEVTERAEVPVVAKEARVVEEVSLGKEVSEREQTIRDTVRKTEVEVENITGTSQTGTTGTTGSTSLTDTGSTGTTSTDSGLTGSGSGVL